MTNPNDDLRERLLAQPGAVPGDLDRYRRDVDAQLERNQRGLQREKILLRILWPVLVLTATGFLVLGGQHHDVPLGGYFSGLACFWLLFGAIELIKHFINRARVEILRDLRRVQLDVAELRTEFAQRRKETP